MNNTFLVFFILPFPFALCESSLFTELCRKKDGNVEFYIKSKNMGVNCLPFMC